MSSHRYRSATLGVTWRTMHHFFTNPALLVPSVVFPLFFFAAFAGGLSTIGKAPRFHYYDYTAFQFVFVLLQSAAFGGLFTGFSLASDFEGGIGRRMMLAVPYRSAIVLGYVLAGILRFAFTCSILVAVAALTGMPVRGGGVDLLGLFGLALLVNLCGALWAIGLGLRFKSIQAGPLMQTPVFLVLFLAPVYVPRELLAGWIHTVSGFNPATAAFAAGRGFLAGEPTSVGIAFASFAALVAVFALWGLRSLRRAEASA